MRARLDLLDRPQPKHFQRPMIQFPAVVLPHGPILSDQAAEVDLLMNCLVSRIEVDVGERGVPERAGPERAHRLIESGADP
jgi:hypothetical protein